MEEALRTIRDVPLPTTTGPIDTFAGSQVKQGHPDLRKWTPAIHQLTIWVGRGLQGAGAKARWQGYAQWSAPIESQVHTVEQTAPRLQRVYGRTGSHLGALKRAE